MKKSTKRLISSILTAAMLLTSVTVNPLSAFAADYTQDTLTGLTCETATVDNVKTTTWTFAPPADGADKINAGDTVEGILITGEGSKTWNDSNKFAVSKSMGFSLPISDNCTGGTVAITSTSNNSARYLYLETDPSVTVPYNTSENTVEFTSANVVNGYLSFINNPTGGDYKMSKIVLVENLSGDSGETTTETSTEAPTEEPTEATTEASTEASTEAPTEEPTAEPTTEAPVVGDDNSWSADSLALEDPMTASPDLGDMFSYTPVAGKSKVTENEKTFSDGVSFANRLQAGGKGTPNGEGSFTVVAPSAGTLTVYFVTGSNAAARTINFYDSDAVTVLGSATSGPITDATTYVYEPAVFTVPAAGTYYVAAPDAAVNYYGMTFTSEGGETTTEPTTEAPTETPTETPTEEPTEAPTEESTVEPTTEAPTETPTEESTEGTTEAPAPSGGYAYIPSVPIASGATAYDDANASIVAMQNLDITANTEGAVTIGDNSYTTNLVSTSTNTQLNVDGSSGNYRVAFSVTAKTDITVKVDVKVGAGKEVYLTAGPVTAGSTCSAIDGRNNVTADIYTTLTADVAAGDTIYFVGKGTNAPVYGVDIIAKGGSTTPTEATTEVPAETTTAAPVETTTDASTETTTTAPVAGTINIGASVDGVASNGNTQTLAADAIGTTVKVNIDLANVEGTAGYNNYTFFIKYNPSVLKAVSVAEPSDLSGYSLANGAVVYDANAIANSISYVPSTTNADYTDVNADGTKTAADLGKIKIANYLDGNSTVATTSGTLVALNFEVVGAGSSDLEIVLVENGIFAAPGADAEITAVAATNTVVVEGEVSTETTTSEVPTETSTSEIPTETTTSEVPTETTTSEPITAPEGTLGVGITPNGNVTANVGDTVTFNVDVVNAEEVPFNNYTYFISYDPNVIEAVQAVNPTDPATVDGTPAYTLVSNLNGVDNSINYKPSATNPDFANLGADGVKTAAQLGKIKIADYVGEDGVTLVNNSGTLMSIQFVVKAEGDTKLTITKVDNGFYGAVGSEIIDVMPINNTITITSGDEPGPEPAPGIAGDVNMDGNITADDASFTLQKTLNNAFELPCQTAYPDTYMLIVDVNNDGNITADDASYILQKTLNNAFDFPIDAVRGE